MPHGGSVRIMAAIKLEPPEPFDFQWRNQFEQYHIASRLANEDPSCQVWLLLFTMSQNVEDMLMSVRVTDNDRKDYQKVLDKFDKFY